MRALILGASGGIGAALARALHDHDVHTLSRSADGLDVTDEASVRGATRGLPGPFDLIVNTIGVLTVDGSGPERSFGELDAQTMANAYAVNTIGAALLFKHLLPHLAPGRSAFATLSARIGSIGDNDLGGWRSYRASKAALTQIVRCAAIEARRKNPDAVILALHPGTIETDLTRPYARGRYTATADEAARNLLDVIANATHSGSFLAYDGSPIPW